MYAVCVNGSDGWPMYGVYGGEPGSMGFSLDSHGEVMNTWGPSKVSGCVYSRHDYIQWFVILIVAVVVASSPGRVVSKNNARSPTRPGKDCIWRVCHVGKLCC